MRNTFDVAFETRVFTDCDIGQSGLRDLGHMAGAFIKTTKFTAVARGPPHHLREFGHDFIVHSTHSSNTCHHKVDTVLQRTRGPCGLCSARSLGQTQRGIKR